MSDLVMRAAELIEAIVKERVADEASELRAQLNTVMEERGEARRDRDRAMHERDCARMERDEVRAHSLRRFASIREALGAPMEELADDAARRVVAERDAARAELHTVRTELEALIDRKQMINDSLRDELVSEQAKCAKHQEETSKRIADFEAKLAALVPVAPMEADEFCVDDLVYAPGSDGRVSRIVGVANGIKLSTHEWHHNADPLKLTRKHVEVGDTVRVTEGLYGGVRGRVFEALNGEAHVALESGWGSRWLATTRLVAVSP